ncbi:protein VACUOLELESS GAMETOPHYTES-like [Ziziphus jujuba]|uniref:Protein VACUOLELESS GAMETOPHYTES-like n=1 Tax=Ziziphus jujuba TaxID=326968 RepID=A0ABM4AHS1_ZIZJJ|nr:protein VACUOLELESS GAMETOPHYTES-like [Ziziphus jujuba]
MEVKHFMHKHPLVPSENVNERVWCSICERSIKGPNYACVPCKFYLHKSCAEFPQHLNHSFHPEHPLTLCTAEPGRSFGCQFCSTAFSNKPSYSCSECKFVMDTACALLVQKINHPFHPLVLFPNSDYWCDSCHRSFTDTFAFHCKACNFTMDYNCALMDPITCEGHEHIQHFSHQHPMELFGKDDECRMLCYACSLWRSAPIYGCRKCMYFLHKSCAELPLELRHPFHPSHTLLLRDLHGEVCNSCLQPDRNFVFHCKSCNFNWVLSAFL